jgi:hypothetical protein
LQLEKGIADKMEQHQVSNDVKLLVRKGATFASKEKSMTIEDVLEIIALRRDQVSLLCQGLWNVSLKIR